MESLISFLEQMSSQADTVAFAYDAQTTKLVYLSEGIKKYANTPVSEIKEQPALLLDMIAATDREYVIRELQQYKKQPSGGIDIEFRAYLPDQTTKWVRLKTFKLKAADQLTYHTGMLEDISKRKEFELTLTGIKEQKNIVIQVMGHDLRAPLNNIAMAIDMIGDEIDLKKNEKVKELIDIVERTCRNSLDMIKEVLSMEYIETQEMGIKRSRVDVISRVRNQIDTFRLLDKSHKTFLLHTNTESLLASTDSIRLMLIVENLLTNAYKFTSERGRIDLFVEERDEHILITVKDNGIGIPDTLKPMIFDKFTKARRKGNQGEQPVGLGMHIIKTMVEQLNGRIWFESQEGVGTSFFVELPK